MKKKDKSIEKDAQSQKIACAKKTSIGGQALMEGIMMRGPKKSAMAVRNPQGEIVLEVTDISTGKRPFITKIPVARGVYNFVSSMIIGYKALMRSAEISGLEEIEEELAKEKAAKKAAKQAAKKNKNLDNSSEITETDNQIDNSEALESSETAETVEIIEETPVEEIIYPEVATVAEPPIEDNATASTASEQSLENSTPANDTPKDTAKAETKKSSSGLTATITIIAGILGVALALLLFIFLPDTIAGWLSGFTPDPTNWRPVFAGFIKIIILIAYMSLVCLMKDIRRTFEYHGAEHKTIFCYEAGLELTVENVRKQRRFHPRCGTSFLILMLIISIGIGLCINPIYQLITGTPANTLVFSLIKLCLLPLTMGIGYELIKIAGKHDNWFTRFISAPGVWLQHITVLEPDDSMIECAIVAMKEVIPDDDSDKW